MVTKQYQKGQCGKYENLPKTNTDKTRAGFSKRRAAGQHLSPDVPAGFLPLRARGGRRIRAGPGKPAVFGAELAMCWARSQSLIPSTQWRVSETRQALRNAVQTLLWVDAGLLSSQGLSHASAKDGIGPIVTFQLCSIINRGLTTKFVCFLAV